MFEVIMTNILSDKIRSIIEGSPSGAMSFYEFMEAALYDPEAGYYTNNVQIGRGGDFVTAPEVSPLFARCLARQYVEVAELMGCAPDIVEFGAGSGRLAFDIMQALDEMGYLPPCYRILDLSGRLKHDQAGLLETLPVKLYNKISWMEALPEEPIDAFVIANEVIDAMPVHKIFISDEGSFEFGVGLDGDSFVWKLLPLTTPGLTERCDEIASGVDIQGGYETEVNVTIAPWLTSLSNFLARGAVFIIDYGFPRHEYYAPSRKTGTLMCHGAMKSHADPLFAPGAEDITAHVDFTEVAEAALAAGFVVEGYTAQAHFLLSLGILDDCKTFEDRQAVKLLAMPHEMGELFKVMALAKGISGDFQGFQLDDRRGRL